MEGEDNMSASFKIENIRKYLHQVYIRYLSILLILAYLLLVQSSNCLKEDFAENKHEIKGKIHKLMRSMTNTNHVQTVLVSNKDMNESLHEKSLYEIRSSLQALIWKTRKGIPFSVSDFDNELEIALNHLDNAYKGTYLTLDKYAEDNNISKLNTYCNETDDEIVGLICGYYLYEKTNDATRLLHVLSTDKGIYALYDIDYIIKDNTAETDIHINSDRELPFEIIKIIKNISKNNSDARNILNKLEETCDGFYCEYIIDEL